MIDVFISVKDIFVGEFKWIDTRFSLAEADAGRKKYEESHIAGALYWDLNKDLSDLSIDAGRHPLPSKEKLVELFERSGLYIDDPIIVYDDGGSPFATRAWWILQYAGFTKAFIALEGFETMKNYNIPVNSEKPAPKRTTVAPNWNEDIYATREEVAEIVENGEGETLLDARAAKRYRGEVEPLDKVAGHIPGALNFDWEQLKENGAFQLTESVQGKLADTLKDEKNITVYCGSGVTAAPVYAALKQFGYDDVRLYVGSYSDWISKENAPIEKA